MICKAFFSVEGLLMMLICLVTIIGWLLNKEKILLLLLLCSSPFAINFISAIIVVRFSSLKLTKRVHLFETKSSLIISD